MQNENNNQAGNLPLSNRLVAVVALSLILLVAGSSLALAQEDLASVRQVQVLENEELGLTRPAGLAYSPAANALMVVEAPDPDVPFAMFTGLKVITPVEGRVGTVLLLVAVADPLNMAFDGQANRLLLYEPTTEELIEVGAGPDGHLNPAMISRHDARRFGLERPQGMAVDPASGQLFILDGAGPRLVIVEPDLEGGFGDAVVRQVDLDQAGLLGLQGLAFDPTTGHLYVLAPVQQMLYELTLAGEVVASRDLSPFALGNPQGMVFAPSGDMTDDPSRMSLYIADSGLAGGRDRQATAQSSGRIVELSFHQVEPQAPTVDQIVADVINTIDTSVFDPPSPDPAGIIYLQDSGTLLVADSEVDEIPLWRGGNLWEVTLSGSVVITSTTWNTHTHEFSDEPTGITLDHTGGRMFFSDDTRREVFVVDLGPDGEYDLGDDRDSFDTAVYGSNDPEGVTYDTWDDVLFVSDGVNNEVYRVDPGLNGIFDGVPDAGGDDVVTQWDTEILGILDPGGITFDPITGHLFLVGRPGRWLFEVSTSGTLLREIDISAAPYDRPAGLTFAPRSDDPNERSLYVADRGIDSTTDPAGNDGQLYELSFPSMVFHGVTVEPTTDALSGDPDTTVVYTLRVTNTGNAPDTFDVTIPISTWSTEAPGTVGPLDPDEGADVEVTVTVPGDALCGESDTATVTFTSQGDGTKTDSSELTTTAEAVSAVTIIPPSDSSPADQGEQIIYHPWVQNVGNCADTFDLAVSGNSFPTDVQSTVGPLAPGEGANADVAVTVPELAVCGDDVATLTATSQADVAASASSVFTTSVNAVYGVTVTPPTDADSGDPGTVVTYTLRVTNAGNCADVFDVGISDDVWTTLAPTTVSELAPYGGTDVEVTVSVPADAGCQENDMATITFSSQSEGSKTDSSQLTTSANAVYAVTIEPHIHSASGDPGAVVTHTLRVTNAGNCEDTMNLAITGDIWPTEAPGTIGPLAPDVGADVDISVTVPACTPGGESDALEVTAVSQQDGTAVDSAALTTEANQLAPVAGDDEYSALEDTPKIVGAPGVLGNDDDANCDTLTVSWNSQPDNGAVVLDPDGSFVYTPDPNFDGEDIFTYRASDGVLTDTATVTITVLSAGDDPIVSAGDDQSADEGEVVRFEGSFVDPARSPVAGETFHWDFGDGKTATGTLTPGHVYRDDGDFAVTLTVTDTEGDVGQDSLVATINNVAPTVDAGPDQSAVPGELIIFSGSFTDPGLDDTHTFQWDMGNGIIINDVQTFSYAYDETGVYTVTLTVTDDDGGVGIDTVEITVMHRTYLPVLFRAFVR